VLSLHPIIVRSLATTVALLLFWGSGLPAQSRTFPVDELRAGMVGIGKTVFEGDRLDEFQAHIIGVLHNTIGPRRNLILARLEGGPLARTGVIAGMSGSPVYIDDRLVGAVSYSLGQFSTEPIAGITPIGEMTDAATFAGPGRQLPPVALDVPLTPEALNASFRQAFSWMRPFARSPADVQILDNVELNSGIGTMLRPIATPLTFGGFDADVLDPLTFIFRDQGFVPVTAGTSFPAPQMTQTADTASAQPLRPGDPVGVTLMSGDLQMGATGTVTEIAGDRVFAFGHPFYGLGPTQFPMTRARVLTVLPSLANSTKIASTGEVIGVIEQDRATTIAGRLGPGPALIPLRIRLASERGTDETFNITMVNDRLFTPTLAYLSILNTLNSYERQNGVASYTVRGTAVLKDLESVYFEDVFTGDQPALGVATYVVAPINVLLRNAFADVQFERLDLEIEASEEPRTATLERVWVDEHRPTPGETVNLKMLLRTYRGEEITRALPVEIPARARGNVSIMVADGTSMTQWETRELQIHPMQARGLPQMIRVLNSTRKHNRLYVRLLGRDNGAIVEGEALSSLPSSVLAVMEADRNGGSFRPLQSAMLGKWNVVTEHAVTGTRTLTLALEE